MKTLYFECQSGISGDMTVASLIDLGVPSEVLLDSLKALKLNGYKINISKTQKSGISAVSFDVIVDADERPGNNEEEHEHRTLKDIRDIIQKSALNDFIKETVLSIFNKLAKAEGKIHNVPVDKVCFHEVSALDSIVDIVSAAVCVDHLRPDTVEFSVLREGTGHIKCHHGIIPVPVPATLELLKDCGAKVELTNVPGEMITPTGAAIAASLGLSFGNPCPSGRIVSVGYGAGKRDFEHPNIIRSILVESEGKTGDRVCVLETVIDDCSGEELGYAMQKLFELDVKDVYFTPSYMKKNRPAITLTVICATGEEEKAAKAIFKHTSSIGIRKSYTDRIIMSRKIEKINTKFGPIDIKRCVYEDINKAYPEYESLITAANKHNVTIKEVINELDL